MTTRLLVALLALTAMAGCAPNTRGDASPSTPAEGAFDPQGEGYEPVILGQDALSFLHRSTVQRNGQRVRAWFINNSAPNSGQPFASMRVQMEFDCRERLFRPVTSTVYDRAGAKGRILAHLPSTHERPWQPVPPGSLGEHQLDSACKPTAART
jgi:hypothetical protein